MLKKGLTTTLDTVPKLTFAVNARWFSTKNLDFRLFNTQSHSVQTKKWIMLDKSSQQLQVAQNLNVDVKLVNLFHQEMVNPALASLPNRAIQALGRQIGVEFSEAQKLLMKGTFAKDVESSQIDAFLRSLDAWKAILEAGKFRQKLDFKGSLNPDGTAHTGELEVASGDTNFADTIMGADNRLPGRWVQGSFLTRTDLDGGIVISVGVESIASIFQNTSLGLCQLLKGAVTKPVYGVPRPLSPQGADTIKYLADYMAAVFTPCGKVNLVFPEGLEGPLYVALRGTAFPSACVQVAVERPRGSRVIYRSAFKTPYKNPLALSLRHLKGLGTCWDTVVFEEGSSVAIRQEVPDWVKTKYENVLPVEGLTHSLTDALLAFEPKI